MLLLCRVWTLDIAQMLFCSTDASQFWLECLTVYISLISSAVVKSKSIHARQCKVRLLVFFFREQSGQSEK